MSKLQEIVINSNIDFYLEDVVLYDHHHQKGLQEVIVVYFLLMNEHFHYII